MYRSAYEVEDAMRMAENPVQRANLIRFFKTGKGEYVEGDEFLGIKNPEVHEFVREAATLPLPEVKILLESRWHEVRQCGFLILVRQFEKAARRNTADSIPQRDAIVDFYLAHARRANNWDLVDLSCYKILGRWLLMPSRYSQAEKSDVFNRLASSNDLWERRMSIVSTLGTLMAGDASYTLHYAAYHIDAFMSDPKLSHDLMHKAVGWMLREMGKRCGMDLLRDFLAKYHGVMPRTTLRYAIERMDEEERTRWMKQ